MPIITSTSVHFRDGRSGTAPATYGQRTMWGFVEILGAGAIRLNVRQAVPIPPGSSLPDVLGAIAELPLRHEALRTRFRTDDEGELWQEVSADGDIPVELWDLGDDDEPDAVRRRAERMLADTLFDLRTAWPMRLLVGSLNGVPAVVLMAISHVAADLQSARIVAADLADAIAARTAGRPLPELPERRQPLDLARYEQSSEGRRRLHRTLTDWQRRLLLAPRTMVPRRPVTGESPRFWRGEVSSRALAPAVNALAIRHSVSTSIIYMAALSLVLAHHAGSDRAALEVTIANRPTRDLRWSVGNLTQSSLAVIDVTDTTFADLVQRTWSAWLRANRAGHYDYPRMRALRRRVELARGIGFDLECFFNDVREDTAADRSRLDDPATIAELADATTFDWTELIDQEATKWFFRVSGTPDVVELSALVDTAFWSPEVGRDLLMGIERLLIWQATKGLAEPELPLATEAVEDVTGVAAPRPDSGWLRIEGGWVEVAAVGDLLREVTADLCDSTHVAVEKGPEGERLVGYLLAPDPHRAPSPEEIHQRCAAALVNPATAEDRWLSARTPQHYVICGGVPVRPDGRLAWEDGGEILAEGPGRSADVTV